MLSNYPSDWRGRLGDEGRGQSGWWQGEGGRRFNGDVANGEVRPGNDVAVVVVAGGGDSRGPFAAAAADADDDDDDDDADTVVAAAGAKRPNV